MRIRFKSLSSGSCGNCYYLGVEHEGRLRGILIDAGVSPRMLKRELQREGMTMDDFEAILITHDHLDHIRSLGSYCKHCRKPVWSAPLLGRKLVHHYVTGEYLNDLRLSLSEGWNEVIPGLVSVRYFVVPHDASETVGYAILAGGLKYVHITDCGALTQEALSWCSQADVLVLESNYDAEMLENGPYPQQLKDRIRSGHGHLSNDECAEALRQIMHKSLKYVFLCHLSEHNNTPELALESARSAVPEDYDVRVIPLPRQNASPLYHFDF